jgi:hypothetical protein
MGKRARNLLVWLHVVTSVGWMGQAVALFALLTYGLATGTAAAYAMAEVLDLHVLAHLANTSAFTGLMLSALTRWGYAQYWWVLAKLVITLVQLYVGIFLLGPRLRAIAHGELIPSAVDAAFPLLMASAIAFQAWLSVAKPASRTPWTGTPAKAPAPATWFVVFVFAVPVLDYLLAVRLGHPAPLFFALTAITYPIWRARRLARSRRGAPVAASTRENA